MPLGRPPVVTIESEITVDHGFYERQNVSMFGAMGMKPRTGGDGADVTIYHNPH